MELLKIEGSYVTMKFHWAEEQLITRAFQAATGAEDPIEGTTEADMVEALAIAFEPAALAGYMQGASDAERITPETLRAKAEPKVTPINGETDGDAA